MEPRGIGASVLIARVAVGPSSVSTLVNGPGNRSSVETDRYRFQGDATMSGLHDLLADAQVGDAMGVHAAALTVAQLCTAKRQNADA